MLAGRRAISAHSQICKSLKSQSATMGRFPAPAGVPTCCALAAPSRRAATTNHISTAANVLRSSGNGSDITLHVSSGSLTLGRQSSHSTARRVATAATTSAPSTPQPSQPSQPGAASNTSNQIPAGGASSSGAASSGPLYPTPQSELTLHSLLNTGARLTAAAQAAWAQVGLCNRMCAYPAEYYCTTSSSTTALQQQALRLLAAGTCRQLPRNPLHHDQYGMSAAYT